MACGITYFFVFQRPKHVACSASTCTVGATAAIAGIAVIGRVTAVSPDSRQLGTFCPYATKYAHAAEQHGKPAVDV